MAVTRIGMANQALVNCLSAAPIATLDERSLEAREASRVIDQVIGELLEGPHDWSWQVVRQQLTPVTNDRAGEWAKAYAAPSDIMKPIGLYPIYTNIAEGYIAYPGTDARLSIPYLWHGGKIYTNLDPAMFAYISSSLIYEKASKKFGWAVSTAMAARMAIPLKKSRELKGDLLKEAQVAMERAIADDFNTSPQQTPDYVTDVELAREGYGDSIGPRGI